MRKSTLFLLILLLVPIAILIPASLTPNLFTLKRFGLDEVSQLLTFLALIALFLERSLEVFMNTWRRPGEEEIDNKVKSCERRITELKAQMETQIQQTETVARIEEQTSERTSKLEKTTEVTQTPGNVEALRYELSETLQELGKFNSERAEYKSGTRKTALWVGLFIGLLISGVGIRSLETLITLQTFSEQKPIFYDAQVCLFRILDTLLTGGLVAGGSDGIHKLTQVFTAFLEETRNQIKDKPS